MRIAFVGDSVMWGQGLTYAQKFSTKTVLAFRKKADKVDFFSHDFRPHSGGKIGVLTANGKPQKNKGTRGAQKNGEIPDPYETVPRQIERLPNPKTIDILVLDGVANDIGFLDSVDLFPENFYKFIAKRVPGIVREQVPKLLKFARKRCPQATILYTGYYAGLSPLSSIPFSIDGEMLDLLQAPMAFNAIGSGKPIDLDYDKEKEIKLNGVRFHERMLGEIRSEIAKFNQANPSQPPVVFVNPGFTWENAVFANKSYIFGPLDTRTNKHVIRNRINDYLKLDAKISHNDRSAIEFLKSLKNNIATLKFAKDFSKNLSIAKKLVILANADVGHPSPEGAAQYASRLIEKADQQLSFSLRDHMEAIQGKAGSVKILKTRGLLGPSPKGSLRQLADIRNIDTLTMRLQLFKYTGQPGDKKLRQLKFDLGFGKKTAQVLRSSKQIEATADFGGNHPFSDMKKIDLYWEDSSDLRSFEGIAEFFINGRHLQYESLNSAKFQKSQNGYSKHTLQIP